MNTFLFMMVGEDPLAPKHSPFSMQIESIMLFGAMGLVVLGLLIWAYLYYSNRRQGHRRHRHHHHHHRDSERHHDPGLEEDSMLSQDDNSSEDNTEASEARRYRRRRRRRREHRPRNPTLAETGGLPPVRTDAPPGP